MTGTIPHPYTERMAADWLASVLDGEEGVVFAIVHSDTLIGCTGYRAFSQDHAELGYWIGKPYWGMGYATEAVRALLRYGQTAVFFRLVPALSQRLDVGGASLGNPLHAEGVLGLLIP